MFFLTILSTSTLVSPARIAFLMHTSLPSSGVSNVGDFDLRRELHALRTPFRRNKAHQKATGKFKNTRVGHLLKTVTLATRVLFVSPTASQLLRAWEVERRRKSLKTTSHDRRARIDILSKYLGTRSCDQPWGNFSNFRLTRIRKRK